MILLRQNSQLPFRASIDHVYITSLYSPHVLRRVFFLNSSNFIVNNVEQIICSPTLSLCSWIYTVSWHEQKLVL